MLDEFTKPHMPKFLGIGSAFNTELGNTSCYFWKDAQDYGEDRKYPPRLTLIDCGWDVYEKIKSKGLLKECPAISIYITHTHGDHIGSLSILLEYSYYVNEKPCVIYYHDPVALVKILDGLLVKRELYHISESDINNTLYDKTNYLMPHIVNSDKVICSYAFNIKPGIGTYIFAWDSAGVSPDVYNKFLEEVKSESGGLRCVYLFHDCCMANYPGNVHTYYKLLLDLVPEELRSHVFPVHIDDEKVLDIMVEAGFGDVRELLV